MSSLMSLAETVLSHPNSIFSILDNGTKVYTLHGKASALKELTGFAANLETHSGRQILNLFNSMPEDCKSLLSEQTQEKLANLGFFQWLDEKQKAAIVSEIEQCQSKLVNSILYKELFCASTLIITQVSSLVKLSKELAQAANLVEESKGEIDRIILKLDELVKMQTEMSETMAKMEGAAATGSLDQGAVDQLSDDINELIASEAEVRRSLDQVKLKVGGKIVRLGDQRNVAIRDACVDASQVVGNLIEYNMAGEMFSVGLSALKFITTSFFAAMSVLKYEQSVITSRRIEELSEVMKQVVTLEEEVATIRDIIFRAMRWTREKRKAQRLQQQNLA